MINVEETRREFLRRLLVQFFSGRTINKSACECEHKAKLYTLNKQVLGPSG